MADPTNPWQDPEGYRRSLAGALAERLAELMSEALANKPPVIDVGAQSEALAQAVWAHYAQTEPLAELKDALAQRQGWLVGEYVLAFEFLTPVEEDEDIQTGIYTMVISSEGPLQVRHKLATVLAGSLQQEGPIDPGASRPPI